MALVEIDTYTTVVEGRTAVAKRRRAAKHHAVLTHLKRDLYDLVGQAGFTCVDINGDPEILVPFWQGARLDHIEVRASGKVKHCACCEVGSLRQLARHPPTCPMRDAAATEALVTRALAADEARKRALATQPIDRAERRRTKRRLARLKRKLARRGLNLLPNSFFGLARTHPYMVYTWSELHIIWQGIVPRVINGALTQLEGRADDWLELLQQVDRAWRRWASGLASVRGKTKAGGPSRLLAREGETRLCRVTKYDIYGLALFFHALAASTDLLDDDALKGIARMWAWVKLTRSRDAATGQRQHTASQLARSAPMLESALRPLKRTFDDAFGTSKVHRGFHFEGIIKEQGNDHDEDTGESTHKYRKRDSKDSNQKNEHMQMAERTEEREGLLFGRRMVRLRDGLLCDAARVGCLADVRALLQSGVPPTACDADETPALILAAGAGRARVVKLLLRSGAAIDVRDKQHASALTAACRHGHPRCVQLLLDCASQTLPPTAADALLTSRSNHLTPGEWALAGGALRHLECARLLSGALGRAVTAAPPSRLHWQHADPMRHRLQPLRGAVRHLDLSRLKRGSRLCRAHPFLLELRKALHLYLANKPREYGPGHVYDAACDKSDLPDLDHPLPERLDVHPGVRLGEGGRIEDRERVRAAPTIEALLGSDAAPHGAVFAGDSAHTEYRGIARIFLSFTYGGRRHEVGLFHWLVVEKDEFDGAEDLPPPPEDEEEEGGDEGGEEEEESGEGEGEEGEDEAAHESDPEEGSDQYYTDDDDDDDDASDDDDDGAGGSEPSESETDEESGEESEGEDAQSDAGDESWRLPELVYAHLPANQRDRDEAARKGKGDIRCYASRNFYQVMPIQEIRCRATLFPADVWDIDDPERFLLCADGWGM